MAIPLPTLDPLDAITIATPCTVPWREMRGDERSRFCGQCQKRVYDLSALTTAEATELLGDQGNRPCIRLYRRPDGRVLTADCPVGLSNRVWLRLQKRAAWAASLFAMLFLPACKQAFQGMVQTDYDAAVLSGLTKGLETPSDGATNTSQTELK